MNFRINWLARAKTITGALTITFMALWVNIAYAGLNDDLFKAIEQGDLNQVKNLIVEGAEVNAKSSDNGTTALIVASSGGHLEIVQALLAAGADVNAIIERGFTALIVASSRGHLEIVLALLAAEADVNARTENGFTALTAASSKEYQKIVEQLIKAGAHY